MALAVFKLFIISFSEFYLVFMFGADEEAIRKHFKGCGEIGFVKMFHHSDGRFKGKAFVKYLKEESRHEAIKLSGSELMGRKIYVELPKPKFHQSSVRREVYNRPKFAEDVRENPNRPIAAPKAHRISI